MLNDYTLVRSICKQLILVTEEILLIGAEVLFMRFQQHMKLSLTYTEVVGGTRLTDNLFYLDIFDYSIKVRTFFYIIIY